MEPTLKALQLELFFNDKNLGSATGFLVHTAGGVVMLTNRHVVTGKNNFTGKHLDLKTLAEPNRVVIGYYSGNKIIQRSEDLYINQDISIPRWKEHPKLGASGDFVAITNLDLSGLAVSAYDLSQDDYPICIGPAEPVSVVGFPFGIDSESTAIWATGFVASEPETNYNGLPIQLIDCRTRKGQSGSAVLAFRGSGTYSNEQGHLVVEGKPISRFIGIYSGRVNEESDLGMVWKKSALLELIASL